MAFLHRPVALLLLIAPISLLVPLRTDAAAIRASTSLTIPLNVSLTFWRLAGPPMPLASSWSRSWRT